MYNILIHKYISSMNGNRRNTIAKTYDQRNCCGRVAFYCGHNNGYKLISQQGTAHKLHTGEKT